MEENGRIDMSRPTVEMKNIVKMFGSFKANDGINLTVHKGEIHAILGERRGQIHAYEHIIRAVSSHIRPNIHKRQRGFHIRPQ